MTESEVTRAPAHVVQTEGLILTAICAHLSRSNPDLSDQHLQFLCAPWVHFFTHSALHRLELHAPPPAPESIQRTLIADTADGLNVPGDTHAFMEFFRTAPYRKYLDMTLTGKMASFEGRTATHVLNEKLGRHASTVAFMPCLPRSFRYLLPLLSLGKIRFLGNKPASVEVAVDRQARQELFTQIKSALQVQRPQAAHWLAARASELFPKSLLEYLPANLREKQAEPTRKVLFSADGWQILDDWKIYAVAQKISHRTHWVGAPNAVSHGSLAVFWQREFEISHMDTYLTWGWSRSTQNAKLVTPFYSPHFAGHRQAAAARKSSALGILISAAARPQHLLEYPYTPEKFDLYINTQLQLATRANKLTHRPVTIRTRPRDLGWDVQAMVKALDNPNVTLEFQQGKFSERLQHFRLHVCDNCSTTIVESFWANHPTLILISDDYFQIAPQAQSEYEELASAGIFHRDMESLLRQLDLLENNLYSWWCSARTQRAIASFLFKQGRTGGGLGTWKRVLLSPVSSPLNSG